MTTQFVLTLALCLLGFTGSILAMNQEIRFTLPVAAQVSGTTLGPGEYLIRQVDIASDTPVFAVYSADGKTHKATIAMRWEQAAIEAPTELNFAKTESGLELSAIRVSGKIFRVVK